MEHVTKTNTSTQFIIPSKEKSRDQWGNPNPSKVPSPLTNQE